MDMALYYPTLPDVIKTLGSPGNTGEIVRHLQKNQILDDIVWDEANMDGGHEVTVELELPDVAEKSFNEGVSASFGRDEQKMEVTKKLESLLLVDPDVANRGGKKDIFLYRQSVKFLEAMSRRFARNILYGNPLANKNQPLGLIPRVSDPTAENGDMILDGGGRGGVNTSILLVKWSKTDVLCTYPKGGFAGLKHTDQGVQKIQRIVGGVETYLDMLSHKFEWFYGPAVMNYFSLVRICNIDVEELAAGGDAAAKLLTLMSHAVNRLEDGDNGRIAFYANRTIHQYLDDQALARVTQGGGVTYDNVTKPGRRVTMFMGYPVRRVDQLVSNEATVTGF